MKNKKTLIIISIIIGACFICVAIILALGAIAPPIEPTAISSTSAPTMPSTQIPIPNPIDKYLQEYGGSPIAYTRIFSITDCKTLQDEFEIAYANNQRETPGTKEFTWTVGYMTAIDDHMREINCYK